MKIREPDRTEERIKQSKWYGNEEVISDVGKLIRCKDCKHYRPGRLIECGLHNACQPNPDFYCADGEEKDGEQE